MTRQTSLAKITRPRLHDVLLRRRLFHLLDNGRASPITWVSGPAGSGKTTLVGSWLDARKLPCLWYRLDESDSDVATFFYYMRLAGKKAAPGHRRLLPLLTMEYRGVPAFAKRYFEDLYSRLKRPHVVVLDNYQAVSSASAFHDVIHEMLSVIPEGVAVVVMSRSAPPATLALLRTYGQIQHIGWDSLKFDEDETQSLLMTGPRKALTKEKLAEVLRMTTGWAAGLVLLAERSRIQELSPAEIGQSTPDELFDYFAAELFEKADPETQAFLIKTSFLPSILPYAAKELTGRKDAAGLLASLSRNHFFTDRLSTSGVVYQYHPLFRAFLQARARQTHSSGERQAISRQAGLLLEAAGHVEDAAELFQAANEWGRYAGLILANAQSMIAQGRNRTLQGWLAGVPQQLLEDTPWLLYWLGVCRMPFDLPEARRSLEKAFHLFRRRGDRAGVLLAWSGVAQTINLELGDLSQLDPWIAMLDDLLVEHADAPLSPQVEAQVTANIFMALGLRQPDHANFTRWKENARSLLDSDADVSLRTITAFYLFSHHMWIGDRAACGCILESLQSLRTHQHMSPLAQVMGKMAESWFSWFAGALDRSLALMSEGLAASKESGVYIWDSLLMIQGVAASLCLGDLSTSRKLLDELASRVDRARVLDKFYYQHESAWHHWVKGEVSLALSHEKQACVLADLCGLPIAQAQCQFAMTHLMRAMGERELARQHLDRCWHSGRVLGSKIVEFMCLLTEAALAFDSGDRKAGSTQLERALLVGRQQDYVYFSWWHAPLMTPLCMNALEAGIEVDYVKRLVRACGLVPAGSPAQHEAWPWPLKIATLGRFEVLKDGQSVRFSGKIQRPLEMLKALIAFGGKSVGRDQIIDALWPDVEGHLGSRSFDMTLHRLRRLLGSEKVIELSAGQLSIDNQYCWVDVLAFEQVSDEVIEKSRAGALTPGLPEAQPILCQIEKAAEWYRGHFLAADTRTPWIPPVRERLRAKYSRLICIAGECYERSGQWEKASAWFEKGLEVNDFGEELYQHLMTCQQRLGRRAEALATYRRCCASLSKAMGVKPSSQTDDILASLLRDGEEGRAVRPPPEGERSVFRGRGVKGNHFN